MRLPAKKKVFNIKKLKLKLKQSISFGWPAVILLFLLVGFISLIYPKIGQTKERWQSLVTNKAQIETLFEKAELLSSMDEDNLRQTLRELEKILPSEKDAILILDMIDGIVLTSGTQVDSVTLAPGAISTESAASNTTASQGEASKNGEDVLKLSLSFLGERKNVESILSIMEKVVPLISISQVRLDYTTSGLSKADIDLAIHFLSLPTILGELGQPLAKLSTAQSELLASLSQFTSFTAAEFDTGEATSSVRRRNLFTLWLPQVSPQPSIPPENLSPIIESMGAQPTIPVGPTGPTGEPLPPIEPMGAQQTIPVGPTGPTGEPLPPID